MLKYYKFATFQMHEEMDPIKTQKMRDGWGLFYESVLKPDHELRQCAHNQECFYELMEWREIVLDYLCQKRNEMFD